MARRKASYDVTRLDQLHVLESSICLEALNLASSADEITVAELAALMGRSKPSLYPHVERLVEVDLLIPAGERQVGRHRSALYRTQAREHYIVFDPDNDEAVEALQRSVASLLRTATREVCASLEARTAVTSGRRRDTHCMRTKSWLTRDELAEANALIDRLQELVRGSEPGAGRRLCSFTVAIAPTRPPTL